LRLAMSGEPGRSPFDTRNLIPRAASVLRTTSSGAVPLRRTLAIRREVADVGCKPVAPSGLRPVRAPRCGPAVLPFGLASPASLVRDCSGTALSIGDEISTPTYYVGRWAAGGVHRSCSKAKRRYVYRRRDGENEHDGQGTKSPCTCAPPFAESGRLRHSEARDSLW
jgi:hypothetical protein